MKKIFFLNLLSFGLFVSALPDHTKQDDYTRKDYRGMDLRGADFSGQYLVNAIFTQANLTGANFSNAELTGAKFQYAILNGANFSGANLLYARFWIYGERWGPWKSWLRSFVTDNSQHPVKKSGLWLFSAEVNGANFEGAIVSPKLKYFLEQHGIHNEMIVR